MKKPVNQIRIKAEKHGFTIIYNQVIQDKTLSDSAFKIFCYILSKSEDFNINIKGLATLMQKSDFTIRRAFVELEQKGYLKRTFYKPNETKTGKTAVIYEINQTPQKADEDGLNNWMDAPTKEELKRNLALKYEESLKSILNIDKIKENKELSNEITELIRLAKINIWKD